MEAETSELDQVVITGYTQTTFKKMTGSVGIITADQLKDQAQPTVDALMQGKIAGVAVSAVTGQPGSTQKNTNQRYQHDHWRRTTFMGY